VGTETGLFHRLRQDSPGKTFVAPSEDMICPNMKLTSLEDVLQSLQTMGPQVTVPEEIRIPAKVALDRMLAVPRD
jgi:quinolinate synthase